MRTETVTETSTITTSTITRTTPTTTIPTPSGFTAVADSPDYVAKRKREAVDAKLAEELVSYPRDLLPWANKLPVPVHPRNHKSETNKHAQRVICTKWITSTATRTTTSCTRTPTRTTTLPRVTSTVRVTKTETVMRTINPAKATRTVTVRKQVTTTERRLQVIQTRETKTRK